MRIGIKLRIENFVKSKDRLEKYILDELDFVFRSAGIVKAIITHYGDHFYNKHGQYDFSGTLLEIEINDLLDAYTTHVHSGCFESIWTNENGWS
jgi:hypothetical protein